MRDTSQYAAIAAPFTCDVQTWYTQLVCSNEQTDRLSSNPHLQMYIATTTNATATAIDICCLQTTLVNGATPPAGWHAFSVE